MGYLTPAPSKATSHAQALANHLARQTFAPSRAGRNTMVFCQTSFNKLWDAPRRLSGGLRD